MKELSFKNNGKEKLKIEFADNNVIYICGPKKKNIKEVMKMLKKFQDMDENNLDENSIDELYEAAAVLMSNNTTKKEISSDYLDEQLDMMEIMEFIVAYTELMKPILENEKN